MIICKETNTLHVYFVFVFVMHFMKMENSIKTQSVEKKDKINLEYRSSGLQHNNFCIHFLGSGQQKERMTMGLVRGEKPRREANSNQRGYGCMEVSKRQPFS